MADDDKKCNGSDVLHMGPVVNGDGTRQCVRHTKDHKIQVGYLSPVKDGAPLNDSDLINLTPRDDGSYDVEELYTQAKTDSKPAMVNSERFKSGWDRIYGKQTVGVA